MRIYELLKQWCKRCGGESEIAYTVDVFKDLIALNIREELVKGVLKEINKGYKNFNNLKSKVLIPSIEEINEKSEMIVSFEEVRKTPKGKVHGIIFKVKLKADAVEVKNSKKTDDDNDDNNDVSNENTNESSKEDSNIDNTKNSDDFINKNQTFLPSYLTLSNEVKDLFRMDFAQINFNDSDYRRFLLEAQHSTFKKDNTSKIDVTNYGYFKSILDFKIKLCFNILLIL